MALSALATIDHPVPFHCSISAFVPPVPVTWPTPVQKAAFLQITPANVPVSPVGSEGNVAVDQAVPFHARARGTSDPVLPASPVATQNVALEQLTLRRLAWVVETFGVVMMDQVVPFHCSANVWVTPAVT
jgi:hypothetical protein